jgi:hypothetical protein
MPAKPAYFRLLEIFDRSSNGFYTLAISAFVLILLSNLIDLFDTLLFGGSDHWIIWSISIVMLVLASLSTILVFYRRNDELVSWLTPHLRRAWRIMKWQWIFLTIIIVVIMTVGVRYSDSETDQDAAISVLVNTATVISSLIFLPWSILGILKLRDATMVFGDSHGGSNNRNYGAFRDQNASSTTNMKAVEVLFYGLTIVILLLLTLSSGAALRAIWIEAHADNYSYGISVAVALFHIPLFALLASTCWFIYAAFQKWPFWSVFKIYLKFIPIAAVFAFGSLLVINGVAKLFSSFF